MHIDVELAQVHAIPLSEVLDSFSDVRRGVPVSGIVVLLLDYHAWVFVIQDLEDVVYVYVGKEMVRKSTELEVILGVTYLIYVFVTNRRMLVDAVQLVVLSKAIAVHCPL